MARDPQDDAAVDESALATGPTDAPSGIDPIGADQPVMTSANDTFATDETMVPSSGMIDSLATDETILPSEQLGALASSSGLSGVRLTSQVGHDLVQGEQVGEYVVDKLIGEGGFGRVFAGQHPVIGKSVAIKVLHVRYSADPDIVSRFVAEARAVNQIGHEGLIDIFAFGTLPDGRHYYVMELLEGETLRSLIARKGRLEIEETVEILRQVGGALDAAHAAGIAHRDFKPDNIFLTPRDRGWRTKLLDFGVAKLMSPDSEVNHHTATGASVGTPAYMAPEQVVGKNVDHRADIYAFGVVAFHMLTGQLPFAADSAFSIMTAHVNEPPPDPTSLVTSLPLGVDEALRWALAKDPAERPPNTMAFIDRLEALARGEGRGPVAPPPTLAVSTGDPAGSKLPLIIGLVILLAAGAWLLVGSGDDTGPDEPVVAAVKGDPQPAVPAVAPDAALPVDAAPPDAAPADAALPMAVQIELTDLPATARVLGTDGVEMRTGPGLIELPRGTSPLALRLEAPGFKARSVTITPDRARTLSVVLDAAPQQQVRPRPKPRPRPVAPTKTPRKNPGKDDLEPF